MHILETYALLSGAKINRCFIEETHVDIPDKDYIVFHPECAKASARQYNQWDHVLDLIYNDPSINHTILQIGSILDKPYKNTNISMLGKTTVNELAYIIHHSKLFLGYDSFPMHLASYYDKKMVCLFAYYARNSGPYFSSPANVSILEPDFTKYKPSFSYIDPNNLINTISPEIIYKSIKKIL